MNTYEKLLKEENIDEMMMILDEYFENAGQPAVYAKGLEPKDKEHVLAMFEFWFAEHPELLECADEDN